RRGDQTLTEPGFGRPRCSYALHPGYPHEESLFALSASTGFPSFLLTVTALSPLRGSDHDNTPFPRPHISRTDPMSCAHRDVSNGPRNEHGTLVGGLCRETGGSMTYAPSLPTSHRLLGRSATAIVGACASRTRVHVPQVGRDMPGHAYGSASPNSVVAGRLE